MGWFVESTRNSDDRDSHDIVGKTLALQNQIDTKFAEDTFKDMVLGDDSFIDKLSSQLRIKGIYSDCEPQFIATAFKKKVSALLSRYPHPQKATSEEYCNSCIIPTPILPSLKRMISVIEQYESSYSAKYDHGVAGFYPDESRFHKQMGEVNSVLDSWTECWDSRRVMFDRLLSNIFLRNSDYNFDCFRKRPHGDCDLQGAPRMALAISLVCAIEKPGAKFNQHDLGLLVKAYQKASSVERAQINLYLSNDEQSAFPVIFEEYSESQREKVRQKEKVALIRVEFDRDFNVLKARCTESFNAEYKPGHLSELGLEELLKEITELKAGYEARLKEIEFKDHKFELHISWESRLLSEDVVKKKIRIIQDILIDQMQRIEAKCSLLNTQLDAAEVSVSVVASELRTLKQDMDLYGPEYNRMHYLVSIDLSRQRIENCSRCQAIGKTFASLDAKLKLAQIRDAKHQEQANKLQEKLQRTENQANEAQEHAAAQAAKLEEIENEANNLREEQEKRRLEDLKAANPLTNEQKAQSHYENVWSAIVFAREKGASMVQIIKMLIGMVLQVFGVGRSSSLSKVKSQEGFPSIKDSNKDSSSSNTVSRR